MTAVIQDHRCSLIEKLDFSFSENLHTVINFSECGESKTERNYVSDALACVRARIRALCVNRRTSSHAMALAVTTCDSQQRFTVPIHIQTLRPLLYVNTARRLGCDLWGHITS